MLCTYRSEPRSSARKRTEEFSARRTLLPRPRRGSSAAARATGCVSVCDREVGRGRSVATSCDGRPHSATSSIHTGHRPRRAHWGRCAISSVKIRAARTESTRSLAGSHDRHRTDAWSRATTDGSWSAIVERDDGSHEARAERRQAARAVDRSAGGRASCLRRARRPCERRRGRARCRRRGWRARALRGVWQR